MTPDHPVAWLTFLKVSPVLSFANPASSGLIPALLEALFPREGRHARPSETPPRQAAFPSRESLAFLKPSRVPGASFACECPFSVVILLLGALGTNGKVCVLW